jgi:prepilin-type N-terminal cleavage/methylation domain-containing protein
VRDPQPSLQPTRPLLRGFTIVELLIVVVLIGIVSAFSVSGWKRVQWRVNALGAADELRSRLAEARSDAMTRHRYSGIVLDVPGKRYLRFIDSNGVDVHNGKYDADETVISPWSELPPHLVVHDLESSLTGKVTWRDCSGTATANEADIAQSGVYSLVFSPDGYTLGTFLLKLGVESFPADTFRISVLPATGLVTLEH